MSATEYRFKTMNVIKSIDDAECMIEDLLDHGQSWHQVRKWAEELWEWRVDPAMGGHAGDDLQKYRLESAVGAGWMMLAFKIRRDRGEKV